MNACIYIAARDLAGLPFGTHQFIIIENETNPYPPAKLDGKIIALKNLGNGKLGYVIGAHNKNNLAVEYFEKSDYAATLEYFDKKRVRFYKSDFSTEVIQVNFPTGVKYLKNTRLKIIHLVANFVMGFLFYIVIVGLYILELGIDSL